VAKARAAKKKIVRTKRSSATNSSVARKKTAARAAASKARKARSVPKPSTLASVGALLKGSVAGATALVSRHLAGASGTDAISMLEADHRDLEKLLKEGEETTHRAVKGRTVLLRKLTSALNIHELLEERVLYPALESHRETKEIVQEGFEEHHVADLILKELHVLRRSHAQWGAKFKVLKENIEHHIKEEERLMFRTARGVIPRDTLQQLGAKMAAMKTSAERGRPF
jgi:hypothetical protein